MHQRASTSDAYAAAGVDLDAATATIARYQQRARSDHNPSVLESIGGFAGCYRLDGYLDPVLVASTDGVGTKVVIAASLRRFDSVGRDLVHHCINDIACLNARPLFLLDYIAVAKLEPAMAEAIFSGVAEACAAHDVALLGGETAQMPGVYSPDAFDLVGTIVGAVERPALPDRARVSAGDAVIGLPANGFHTNGYSLVREILPPARWREPFDGGTIADALLAVHPCYLPYVDAMRQVVTIESLAHITGGGIPGNLPRALPENFAALIERSRLHMPPIMDLVIRDGRLDDATAVRAFNMGVGMCAIVAKADAAAAVAAANDALARLPIPTAAGAAAVIGEIVAARPGEPRVTFA